MKKKLLFLVSSLLLGVTISNSFAQTQIKSAAFQASLQVIHNCADAAASTVDIYANNTLLINDLQFRYASQTFTNIQASTILTIAVAPATSTAASQAIATFTINLAPNSSNIIVADGIVSPSGYSPSSTTAPFSLISYTSSLAASPNATTTSLLVHHGSTDAPIVDVVAPLTGTNQTTPNILINNASYPNFASSYLNLPTANYKIQVRDQYSENVVAEYSAPLQTLGLGGAALSVIASGFLTPSNNSNGPAFGLYVATTNAGSLIPLPTTTITTTRLQAIHNCADAGAAQVDVWFKSAATGTNAILLIDNFAFRTASPFIDVPTAQVLTLSIAPPTSTSVVSAIANFTYNLSPTSKYQLIASGIVSPSGYTPNSTAAPFTLIANAGVKERALSSSNTDVLVFHGTTDAPAVNVVAQANGTIVTNISYSNYNATGYNLLPTNNYTLHVTNVAGTTTVASYQAPLSALSLTGSAITVLASGFLSPSNNSNGAAFGLWAALATGGNLVQLPPISATTGLNEVKSEKNTLEIFPNPTSNNACVKIFANESQDIVIRLIDINGKIVSEETKNIKAGSNSLDLNMQNFSKGIYIISVSANDNIYKNKLIKE